MLLLLLLQLKISGTMTTSRAQTSRPAPCRAAIVWLARSGCSLFSSFACISFVAETKSLAGPHICPVVISVAGQMGTACAALIAIRGSAFCLRLLHTLPADGPSVAYCRTHKNPKTRNTAGPLSLNEFSGPNAIWLKSWPAILL